MTCIRCSREFELDNAADRCPQADDIVCPRCTLVDPTMHRCDMVCQARIIKFINHQPLTDGFMGFGSMTQVTTTTEEFLPSIFRFMYAQVSSVNIVLKEMNKLSVAVKFRLAGNSSLTSQAYEKEDWKAMHLIKVLEDNNINNVADIKDPVPLLVVRPQQWLCIAPETLRLSIDGAGQIVVMSDRHEEIGTPVSDPPPSEHALLGDDGKPRDAYSYYGGKLSSIYGQLVLDKDYVIEFDIEATNPLYTLDFLFPYRYVDLENISVSTAPDQGIRAVGPLYAVAEPMVSDKLTPQHEYKINRADDEHPDFEKAGPFRDTPPIIGLRRPQPRRINSTTTYPITLDNYELISIQFQFAFIPSQLPHNLIVQPKVTERAIPIRTYEQMQLLPEYRDFLIEFDIFNADHDNDRALEVESEIVGYTDSVSERVEVPRLGGEGGPARKVIKQCPPLKSGILEAMSGPMNATLAYKIYETQDDNRTLIASGSKTVRLLANDQIIWSLKDVTSGATYNLEPTLASWVDPHDEDGKLDAVRLAANSFHPNGKLRGNADSRATLEEQSQDVKALYDCLNQKFGIAYGDHPLNYGFQYGDPATAQRILTAPQVLISKTGVCIDFVILFASLMEGLGINPFLIVDETHAFLGWGDYKGVIDDMGFLETTMLGQKDKDGSLIDFETAQASARDYFRENFMFTNDSSVQMGIKTRFGKVLVDLEEARKEGGVRKE
ncbi:MAG TPA: hypothetical protein VIH90_05880 [Candidatus Saccharimonadales bacterium]